MYWNVAPAAALSVVGNEKTCLPWFDMTETALLQFEVIRMIAASLIRVAIILLWLLAISRP
jgi:hypothetical protein